MIFVKSAYLGVPKFPINYIVEKILEDARLAKMGPGIRAAFGLVSHKLVGNIKCCTTE